MAEATALVQRAELNLPGQGEPAVAGFRRDGRLSVYFGADPVYHLDCRGRLRRAYVDGKLYRSQGTHLAELTRQRTATQTSLVRRDLDPGQSQDFLEAMQRRLEELYVALCGDQFELVRIEPPDAEVVAQLGEVLQATLSQPARLAPRVGRR